MLDGKKHIHFIGIGGSGMYPLAQILHHQGYHLSGSDNNFTDTIATIQSMGISVSLTQQAKNICGADLIIYTHAILPDNPELIAAQQSNIPLVDRASLLGMLTQQYQHAICISGTHGKTTTCSMLTQIMLNGNNDPTVVIGGKLPALNGSGRIGMSQYMICEACEYQDNYLKLFPDISVILNIDEDHMEYFKTLDQLISSFHMFASKATKLVIYCGDDPNSCRAVSTLNNPRVSFGLANTNDYYAANIQHHPGMHTSFDVMRQGDLISTIDLFIPGEQNILNGLAACVVAHQSGVSNQQLRHGMAQFTGVARRFDILYKHQNIMVVDDYAHHPVEISVTLQAAKSLHYRRVIAIHQPFTYSRTARLLEDFAQSLQIADMVILSEIMGSREKNTLGISSKDLEEKIPQAVFLKTFEEITLHILKIVQPGDLIITLGCGDVNKCAHLIIESLKQNHCSSLLSSSS